MFKRVLAVLCGMVLILAGLPVTAAAADKAVIYDLSEDKDVAGKSEKETYQGTTYLQDAGSTLATVNYNGGKSIHVTGRTGGNWRGLDIKFDAIGVKADTEYAFVITGRIDGNVPAGTQMVLSAVDSYSYLVNLEPNKNGEFELKTEKMVDAAFLAGNRAFRIMTNNEGELANFFVDSIVISVKGTGTASSAEPENIDISMDDIVISFTDDNMSDIEERGISIASNEESECEIIVDDIDHDGDGAALKAWHKEGSSNYSATPNGVRITFDEALPKGGEYRISAWFYIPETGNNDVSGKSSLIGPSLLINGNSASNSHKFPTSADGAGIVSYDEWVNVVFETDAFPEEIQFIDLRFYTNDFATHPEVWYIDNIEISLQGAKAVITPKWDITLDSLYEAYEDHFLLGNVIEPGQTADDETTDMFKLHYNAVTAENAMKPQYLSPNKGVYNFTDADKVVDWAEANDLPVHGHALVWHSQSAAWLTTDSDGNPLTREEARDNLEEYIKNVAEHFAGKLISWDVVNEAFTNSVNYSGDWKDGLRKAESTTNNPGSPWYAAYENGADAKKGESGADYIYDAFKLVRKYDSAATLYFNDFNDTESGKSQAIAAMVTELNNKWESDPDYDERLLIEGIGMQSHHNYPSFDIDTLEPALERYIETGAEISITELDITVGSENPYPGGSLLSAEDEVAQAQLYAQFFDVLMKYSDHIERVSIWGKADSQSWRGGRLPVLFDGMFEPKEAYYAVLNPAKYLSENPTADAPEILEGTASLVYSAPEDVDDVLWKFAKVINVDQKVEGANPATGKAQVLWDDDYLYVRVEVTDPELDNTSQNVWEQDSVEVFVSEKAERSPSYFDSVGGGQYRVSYENLFTARADSMKEGVITDAKITEDGYIVFLSIPFREISPDIDTVLTFDIQINDGKDGMRTGQSTWCDPKANGYNSSVNWGNLVLKIAS